MCASAMQTCETELYVCCKSLFDSFKVPFKGVKRSRVRGRSCNGESNGMEAGIMSGLAVRVDTTFFSTLRV